MLDQTELQQLRNAIERQAGPTQMILGARLGEIIRQEFPAMNFKAEYRSLRKFIELYLSDWLAIAGPHGQDVKYTLDPSKRAPVEPNLSPQSNTGTSPSPVPLSAEAAPETPATGILSSDELLRQTIKLAIDAMTVEQLRQLVIPAGIMFDASHKAASN